MRPVLDNAQVLGADLASGPAERLSDKERLRRIRNFQSEDFYPALIVRPFTILIMLVIADWKFLTPNRLTSIANIAKLGAAWFLLQPAHWGLAVVLLQGGIVFDHLDGTMARYRRCFTKLGSFYDKVSDIVTWSLIVMVAGWQVTATTHEPIYLVLAAISVISLNVRGYMKWLSQAETERIRWFEARRDPAAAVAAKTRPIVIAPPPVRTTKQWVGWFFSRFSRIVQFEEMDLWLWLSIALLVNELALCLWIFAISQALGMTIMIVYRGIEMAKADRRLVELENERERPRVVAGLQSVA